MSDPNEDAKNKIAKAIVYAARQAFMINSYGMTWEAIEVNTANILAGCSIPADGKMNSAEAVQNTIMERLRTQADTGRYTGPLVEPVSPGSVEKRVALELVEKYHHTKQCLVNVRQQRNALNADVAMVKRELATALDDLKGSELCRDQLRRDLESVGNQMAGIVRERDKALDAYAILRESMRPHPDHARLAELEARNVELRLMLERSQEDREMDVTRLERDRDGFRKGAQYWMDLANVRVSERDTARDERDAAESKVVKLRTVLQNAISDPFNASLNTINHVLEETK